MAGVTARELGEWFDRHAAGLVLYARQWVGREAAEDVVQEVFVKLAGQKECPGNVRAWLLRSVRNGAIDALRMGKRRRVREERSGEARWFETRGEPVDVEGLELAMKGLSAEEREIVILRIWGGATLEEIAEVMGIGVSTVHGRYRQALERLKVVLSSGQWSGVSGQ
jgi:RNA polymerase sigma-70 factor (ECF subfamily)